MKNNQTYWMLLLWVSLMTACREDDPTSEKPTSVPSVTEALRGNMWEIEAWSLRHADGSTQEIDLEPCDIDTWEFYDQENLFIIYAHWQALYTNDGEKCREESYRIVQSYRREDNALILEGDDQGFVAAWGGYVVSDMRVIPVDEENLTITYRIRDTGEDATEKEREEVQVIQTFFRSR